MKRAVLLLCTLSTLLWGSTLLAQVPQDEVYPLGKLTPTEGHCCVHVGEEFPEFSLPSIDGKHISPSDYLGQKNVLLSFVPAAWTPVCSKQWPGYNIAKELFDAHDTVIIGISTDNVPTLYAWTHSMGGLWFPVLSDFWPHGKVAESLGLLRSDGTSERALILIDKKGIVRYVDVHDINERPKLEDIMQQLEKLD